MKHTVLFILLSLWPFFSCKENRVAYEQLNEVEKVLGVNPDSAYVLLNKIESPDLLNNRLFARYCMLYCRTADKLYKDMLYVEQLNRALAWYRKYGTAEQEAWIGLYLGRSYAEDKLFIPAVNTYLDALDLAKEERLYNVAGFICSYMADLYLYTGQNSEEQRKFKEAAEYFLKAGNIKSYAFALRDVAKTYTYQDSLPLALDIALKADSLITEMNDLEGMLSIKNCLGNIYEKKKEYEKAKFCYELSLSYGEKIAWNNASNYLALSVLYYQIDLLDSARYYLDKIDHLTKVDNQYVPTDRLYVGYLVEEEAGNTALALKYLEQYHEAKDSLYDVQKQVDIIDAEKRHNLVTLHKENRRLQNSRYRLIAILVFTCFTCVLVYLTIEQKRLRAINYQQKLLDEKESQLFQLRKEMESKEAFMTTEKEKKQDLYCQMKEIQQSIIRLKCDKLQYSTLFSRLKEQSKKRGKDEMQALSESDWENLKGLIDSACPDWLTFLQERSVNLTHSEVETCYLSFLELSLKEEAILLNISSDSVNKRRLRVRQKLDLVKSGVTIRNFLVDCSLDFVKNRLSV